MDSLSQKPSDFVDEVGMGIESKRMVVDITEKTWWVSLWRFTSKPDFQAFGLRQQSPSVYETVRNWDAPSSLRSLKVSQNPSTCGNNILDAPNSRYQRSLEELFLHVYVYIDNWLERAAKGSTLLIVLLGTHAGLRVSEMTALRWDDINLSDGVLPVREGKGGKTGKVYLSKVLVEALEAVLPSSAAVPIEERTDYVLPCRTWHAVYGRMEAACCQARVRFKGVHSLCHTAGTRLRSETQDLALVADHLRHSSLDTAKGYAKSDNKRLREAVEEW